jgi:hypothetical protein
MNPKPDRTTQLADSSARQASLSLDLDNKWSYLKTHGDGAWQEYPSYLDRVVPRCLEFLRERNLNITFFIVAQDLRRDTDAEMVRSIAQHGHEIGNHTFKHDPWLHLYSDQALEEEIGSAEDHIQRVTGFRVVGFRGPGFSLSDSVLRSLVRRGYEYDASVFPNLLNPLGRHYFFARSRLSKAERKQRGALFGTFADALRPVKPFNWSVSGTRLLEIPVTTMPLLRLPFHMSYLIYLSGFSMAAMRAYWRLALLLCRMTGTEPSMLLHPLDFLGREDRVGLDFFPGMSLGIDHKLAVVSEILESMSDGYSVVNMREHAKAIRQRAQGDLRVEVVGA